MRSGAGARHGYAGYIFIGFHDGTALEPVLKGLAELAQRNIGLDGVEAGDLIQGLDDLLTDQNLSAVKISGRLRLDS